MRHTFAPHQCTQYAPTRLRCSASCQSRLKFLPALILNALQYRIANLEHEVGVAARQARTSQAACSG
jgi:hypothetical protein